jgi:hypothetical protein
MRKITNNKMMRDVQPRNESHVLSTVALAQADCCLTEGGMQIPEEQHVRNGATVMLRTAMSLRAVCRHEEKRRTIVDEVTQMSPDSDSCCQAHEELGYGLDEDSTTGITYITGHARPHGSKSPPEAMH